MNFRHHSRELAFKALGQCDVLQDWTQACVSGFFDHFCGQWAEQEQPVSAEALAYAHELVAGVIANKSEIDRRIAAASQNWDLERMAWVDRNILRVGVYELRHQQHIPWKVCLDEAIELTKTYSGEKSHHFVNAILDRLVGDFIAEGIIVDPERKAAGGI